MDGLYTMLLAKIVTVYQKLASHTQISVCNITVVLVVV